MKTNRKQATIIVLALSVLLLATSACGLSGSNGGSEQPTEKLLEQPTGQPVEQPTTQPLEEGISEGTVTRQWASTATASSEYDNPDWSAMQATGAPDITECGDIETAWSSENQDGIDWLEVGYKTPVYPAEINIYETYTPGSVVRVEVKDEAGVYYVVWEGEPRAGECPRILTIPVSGVDRLVTGVRIHVDQRKLGDWNEIDAVELVGR